MKTTGLLAALSPIIITIFLSSCQKDSSFKPTNDLTSSKVSLSMSALNCYNDQNPSKSINNGLNAYYAFLGNANDLTGHGYDGSLSDFSSDGSFGPLTLTSDRFSHPKAAYNFNGLSDFIEMAQNPVLYGAPDTGNTSYNSVSQFSIYLRFKPQKTNTSQTLIEMGDHAGFYRSDLSLNTDKSLVFDWGFTISSDTGFTGKSVYVLTAANAVHDNCWNDVVVNYNGLKVSVYLNGVLVGTKSTSFTSGYFFNRFSIGATLGTFPVWFFKGVMDEVRVYNRPLSVSEIKYLLKIE